MKLFTGFAIAALAFGANQAFAQSNDNKASCMVPTEGSNAVSVSTAPECDQFRTEPDDPQFKEPDCMYYRKYDRFSGPEASVESVEAFPCLRRPV